MCMFEKSFQSNKIEQNEEINKQINKAELDNLNEIHRKNVFKAIFSFICIWIENWNLSNDFSMFSMQTHHRHPSAKATRNDEKRWKTIF